jgi:hypothetical protein
MGWPPQWVSVSVAVIPPETAASFPIGAHERTLFDSAPRASFIIVVRWRKTRAKADADGWRARPRLLVRLCENSKFDFSQAFLKFPSSFGAVAARYVEAVSSMQNNLQKSERSDSFDTLGLGLLPAEFNRLLRGLCCRHRKGRS